MRFHRHSTRPHASSTWSISAIHTTDNTHQKVPTQENCQSRFLSLFCNPYCESESQLLPIVDRQTFLKQTAKTQSNISATRIVHQFPGTIQDKGNDLLIFLSRDQSLKRDTVANIRRSTFPPRTWAPDRRTLSQCCE